MARYNYCTPEHHKKLIESGFIPDLGHGYLRQVGELSDGVPDSQFLTPVLDRMQTFLYWSAISISPSGALQYACNKDDNFQDPITALVTAEVRGWRTQ